MYFEKIKLKSGATRWICIADGPRNPATGKRRQIKRRGKTKKEARQRVENAIRALQEDGIDESMSKTITFEEVAKHWLQVYAASGVKRGSVRIREKEINILNRYFAKAPIIEISHHMYQQMLLNLDKEGYAHNTISGVNTCANMIFKYAIRNKLIKDNPREDAIVPKKSITVEDLEKDSIDETYFERDELEKFLDAVLKIGLELDKEWFYTLAFTGMRSGELLALKKQDLNFEVNTIRISKSLYLETNNPRKYELITTKNNTIRIIKVDERIMKMLKMLVQKNDKHKLKNRKLINGFHDADFLFQQIDGYPQSPKKLRDRMWRIMKYIDIDKHLTPHSFRHTHISMMTEVGNDLPTIMERVGHTDPNTTLKIYTHVTKKMKQKSANNLSTANNDILEKIVF